MAKAKPAEEGRRVAEAKAAKEARRVAKAKPPEGARAAAIHPGKRPEEMAALLSRRHSA